MNPAESCGCVKAYPNPVQDFITLEGVKNQTEILIVNQNGDEVLRTTYNKQLNVAALPKGNYFIIQEGEKHIRFVKQ